MTGDQDSDLKDQPPKKNTNLYFNWKFALITMKILTRIRIMMMMMTNLCCLEISLNLPPLLLLIVLLPPLPGQVIGVFKKLKLLPSKKKQSKLFYSGWSTGPNI